MLGRYRGEALLKSSRQERKDKSEERENEYKRIEWGLKKYANERRWRGFVLFRGVEEKL